MVTGEADVVMLVVVGDLGGIAAAKFGETRPSTRTAEAIRAVTPTEDRRAAFGWFLMT
jgi:hypothetical protein